LRPQDGSGPDLWSVNGNPARCSQINALPDIGEQSNVGSLYLIEPLSLNGFNIAPGRPSTPLAWVDSAVRGHTDDPAEQGMLSGSVGGQEFESPQLHHCDGCAGYLANGASQAKLISVWL
jgi:hypothetical protein